MGSVSSHHRMLRIYFIICLTLLACLAYGNQESSDKSLSDETLVLGRVERDAAKRRVRKRNNNKKRSNRKSKNRKVKNKRRNKSKKTLKRKQGRRNKSVRCSRQTGPDDSTCMLNIGTVMDYEGNQLGNFERQKKRIEGFNTLVGKKVAKKASFTNSTSYLSKAMGTNRTCSKANSTTISNSAKVTYNTLAKCNTSISGGCTIPAGTYNQTYLNNCLTKFKAVSTKNAECLALISAASANISAACTCYAAALKLVNEVKASKCSAKASFDNIKVAKDKCLGNFSTCKKAEDSTVGLIQSCNGKTTPAPLTTVAAATTTTTTKTTTKAAAPAPAPATTAAATATTLSCKCGTERTTRIVGGTEVNPKNKYPWMVTFVSPDGSQWLGCGGTLVASKYVISAAHCMFTDQAQTIPVTTDQIKIRIGDHDLTSTGEGSLSEMTIDVTKYTNHESYNTLNSDNDITIIELAQEVDLTTYTPACLAKTSDTTAFDGKSALVYGWGTTSYGGSSSLDKLLEVAVPVVTKETCKAAMEPKYTITDGMLCAGGVAGQDSCQGDSGGPLTYKSGTQHVLIGDVSWGDQCALAGSYGVYGRISHYRTWIEGKMTSPKYCGTGPDAD